MKKSKFDEIWDNVIIPIYDEISPREDFYIKRNAKNRIYKQYQKQKNFIKFNYMEDVHKHLDRHKVGACLMYAIVKVQPIVIKKKVLISKFIHKESYSYKYTLLNEHLALYTALSVIESFRQYDIKNNIETFKRPGVCKPMTTNGESYIYNTCLDLYFSKRRDNINVLTFANVFFLLETGEFLEEENKDI